MKSLPIIFTFFIAITLNTACNDDDPISASSDDIIFGSFFGECFGEDCIRQYKLEDGKLYEDIEDEYPNETGNSYNWKELSSEKFDLVKDFGTRIPSEIFDETTITFGSPDAGDWGGLYLSVKGDDKEGRWIIDNINDNIPEYQHDLADAIREHIEILK